MIRSKVCFKCNSNKPISEYYKHAAMADGHLNKCKECTKKDANQHRANNLEKIREYDRQRAKNPERIKLSVEVNRAWRAEDKRRQRCHGEVRKAIQKGLLVRHPCERCGKEKTEAHHEDYDKPLEVMWLCTVCHKQRHKELKEEF